MKPGWFPVTGSGEGVAGTLHHLTLPAVAMALGALAVISRVTRQAMAVARSAGLPERQIIRRHILRNALGPIVTMCGLVTEGMLAGTVAVETVMGLSGIGSLLVGAIDTHDVPVARAVLLLMVTSYIVVSSSTSRTRRW